MSNFKCKFNLTRRPNAVYKLLAKALYFATEALLNFNINKKCNKPYTRKQCTNCLWLVIFNSRPGIGAPWREWKVVDPHTPY